MKDRIRRVINNHQLSCEHTSKYFYILRGFAPVLDHVDIPVKHYEQSMLDTENRYILEEELMNINPEIVRGFDVWTVTFNLFDGKLLNSHGDLEAYHELVFPVRYKNLSVFNEVNPLIGVSENLELNNYERLTYLKSLGLLDR